MSNNESWPGQWKMINEIIGREYAGKPSSFELDQMTRDELDAERRVAWTAEKPHHKRGTRKPLPIGPAERHIPVMKPRAIHELPSWAQQAAIASRSRITAPENRPPRYKAQVWHNGYSVHLGTFDSIEARDAAVQAAKARRAIGLPLKPL